ncbi:hypothetical protein MMC25_001481 [Agyrium rufum]|nr:hypothetical protein [Agyrium rufum]
MKQPVDEACPSYEDTVRHNDSKLPTQSRALSIPERSNEVQDRLISEAIRNHILPALHEQADRGLLKSIIVLIPTRPGFDHQSNGKKEIIGFAGNPSVHEFYLEGEQNNLQFWQQPSVVKDLESSLAAQLNARTPTYSTSSSFTRSPVASPEPSASSPQQQPSSKRSLFGRKNSNSTPPPPKQKIDPNASLSGSEGTWRTPPPVAAELKAARLEEDARAAGFGNLLSGEQMIKVGLQDVSMRMENEMGLYETRTGKAIVVTFEIGG